MKTFTYALCLSLFLLVSLKNYAQSGIGAIFEVSQIDYTYEGDSLLNSEMGSLNVDVHLLREYYGQTSGFINLLTPLGWVVQNVPIPADYSYPSLDIPFQITLEAGINVHYLLGSVSFDHSPILHRPNVPLTFYFPVSDEEVNALGFGEDENEGEGKEAELPVEATFDRNGRTFSYHQPGHKNVEAAKSQCGPMAVANSLQWLEDAYPEYVNIPHEHVPGLKGDTSLVGQLDTYMDREVRSRRRGKGVTSEKGLSGKLKYLAANNITNIKTKHMGSNPAEPNFGKKGISESNGNTTVSSQPLGNQIDVDVLIDEIRKGKDVEFAYYWRGRDGKLKGHFVEIIEAGKVKGKPYIKFVSDLNQNSDRRGTKTRKGKLKVEQGFFSYDRNGRLRLKTKNKRVYPAAFYSQCAEPPTNNRTPSVQQSSFQVPENSGAGTPIGQVNANDPDGDQLTYDINYGNDHHALIIDPQTGKLSVNDPSFFDYETHQQIHIQVRVRDHYGFVAFGWIIIYITDVDEGGSCTKNVALHRPVLASSSEYIYPASYAVDGNEHTRWSSQFSDPQWIYVDLQDEYDICRIVLKWERAFARDFLLQIWNGHTWQTIKIVQHNSSMHNIFDHLHVKARYVRIYGSRRDTQWGYSLYEFEIYAKDSHTPNRPPVAIPSNFSIAENSPTASWVGQVQASDPDGDPLSYTITAGNLNHTFAIDPHTGQITVQDPTYLDYEVRQYMTLSISISDGYHIIHINITIYITDVDENTCHTNLALNRPVTVSSAESLYPGHYAVDAYAHTRWSSRHTNQEWIYVDLGAIYDLCKIVIKWERAYARAYQIMIWTGAQWQTIRTVNHNYSLNNVLENLNAHARYVAIVGTQRATSWGYSIFDYKIYGRSTHNRVTQQAMPTVPPIDLKSNQQSNSQQHRLLSTAEINLYPNPAKDVLNIDYSARQASKVDIQILNIQGKIISTSTKEATEGSNHWQLNIAPLAAGTYILQMKQHADRIHRRFVKR